MRCLAHDFVWMDLFSPFLGFPFISFAIIVSGLRKRKALDRIEGRADQRALFFEETPVGAPEKLSREGVGRAEYGLEFGQGEVQRAVE